MTTPAVLMPKATVPSSEVVPAPGALNDVNPPSAERTKPRCPSVESMYHPVIVPAVLIDPAYVSEPPGSLKVVIVPSAARTKPPHASAGSLHIPATVPAVLILDAALPV